MEWLQQALDSSTTPILTALLLGLLTAISPCPLATNITAIGYISKDIESRKRIFLNGLLYTLGRTITYVVIALILIPLISQGVETFNIQKVFAEYGGQIIAPALVLIGVYMLLKDKINLPGFGFKGGAERVKKKNWWGALLLGVLFALAFCPTSGVFYFGMLIPLSVAETEGYLLPIVFAIATAIPVLIVSWILAFSVAGIGKFYKKMQVFQKWMNIIIAIIFIVVGLYYGYTLWL